MRKVRCAIYTRKSSEEGLEQDFNSLDAQREACGAYILSQASEGWSQLSEVYDDGGISGGTMERPALKRLLADIAAGTIDIVVVYKVDRLTRSLLDFAKLVEAMDKAEVSFVSVTQSFNTTTSMGRLTLNMLLSFAQFEREVTAERIRDKIAASKAKGMWMGGVVPLGYQANGRTLAIDEEQAALIRSIFHRYLHVRNVRLLTEKLSQQGLNVPERVTGAGRKLGGSPFTRGQIYKILSNPIYCGKICHKGEIYEGQHDAIVDRETWGRVQSQLEANAQGQQQSRTARSPCLLAGKVFDSHGNPLIASHATKGTTRYRYYIGKCDEGDTPKVKRVLRIPALELEKLVCGGLAQEIEQPLGLLAKAGVDLTPDTVAVLGDRAASLATTLQKRERAAARTCIEKVIIAPTQISVELAATELCGLLSIAPSSPAIINPTLSIDASLRRSGRAVRLIQHGVSESTEAMPHEHLLKLLHRARAWWHMMLDRKLTVSALAREQQVTSSYASRVVRLNFLAPRIVEAIVTGQQPIDLDAKKLLGLSDLPLAWSEQEELLVSD
ncbi:recombinase family protein [Erythrobacter litoralis]|uniref:recombinase family protein n=1 Tax=Erythrobacter litoralis TaxID=39960 RepID=UPI00243602FB|nr:recombinase family protein [Erythrobacter litoralis]MDG6078935.1 recombinase family protein [Erythrobacter litoralis]